MHVPSWLSRGCQLILEQKVFVYIQISIEAHFYFYRIQVVSRAWYAHSWNSSLASNLKAISERSRDDKKDR